MIVCTTQEKMVLLSNRSILTRGRAPQPISCKDSGFLRIMDALYALSDSYLHFPQEYISKRGGIYFTERTQGTECFSARREGKLYWELLEFIINMDESIEAKYWGWGWGGLASDQK